MHKNRPRNGTCLTQVANCHGDAAPRGQCSWEPVRPKAGGGGGVYSRTAAEWVSEKASASLPGNHAPPGLVTAPGPALCPTAPSPSRCPGLPSAALRPVLGEHEQRSHWPCRHWHLLSCAFARPTWPLPLVQGVLTSHPALFSLILFPALHLSPHHLPHPCFFPLPPPCPLCSCQDTSLSMGLSPT